MNAPPRILVAGIGNIFLGDDAFGVEVAQRLLRLEWPEHVRVVDFGIRGLDLTYALLDRYDAAILIDAAPRGYAPGTLSIIEPGDLPPSDAATTGVTLDTHTMDPVKVLKAVQALGGSVGRLLVVACEPSKIVVDAEDDPAGGMSMGLSPAVQAAVNIAVERVRELVAELALSGDAVADGSVSCTNCLSL